MTMRFLKSLILLAALAGTSGTNVAYAQPFGEAQPVPDVDDLFDLSCSADVSNPSVGGTTLTATGSFSCGRRQRAIKVDTCLYFDGVSVDCPSDYQEESFEASATASFTCLPGVWLAGARGMATNGKSDVVFSDAVLVTPEDCGRE